MATVASVLCMIIGGINYFVSKNSYGVKAGTSGVGSTTAVPTPAASLGTDGQPYW